MVAATTCYPEEVFKSEMARGAHADAALAAAVGVAEIQKFNTCHDPKTGRFCSKRGGPQGATVPAAPQATLAVAPKAPAAPKAAPASAPQPSTKPAAKPKPEPVAQKPAASTPSGANTGLLAKTKIVGAAKQQALGEEMVRDVETAAPALARAIASKGGLELHVAPRAKASGMFGAAKEVSGAYSVEKKTIQVSTLKGAADWGMAEGGFKSGEHWSMSSAASTERRSRQTTLMHEMSHKFYYEHMGSADHDAVRKQFVAQVVKGRGALTKYARTNTEEYFAEITTAYFMRPQALKSHDPGGHALVHKYLGGGK